jgi:hypothetical protein
MAEETKIVPNTAALIKATVAQPQTAVAYGFADRIPSNWDLTSEGDVVKGTNLMTGRTFSGSMEEFNTLLRG